MGKSDEEEGPETEASTHEERDGSGTEARRRAAEPHALNRTRSADGRILPGARLNPEGKYGGGVGALTRRIAQSVREQTDDLEDLVAIMVSIAKGQPQASGMVPSVIQQRAACEYLFDRVLGRAVQPIDARPVDDITRAPLNVSDPVQLEQLERLLDQVLGTGGGTSQPFGHGVVDVPAVVVDPATPPLANFVSRGQTTTDGETYLPTPRRLPRQVRLAESSTITRATWDPETRQCVVTFKPGKGETTGSAWQYDNVTEAQVRAWESAPSVGAWFARELRGGADGGMHFAHPRRKLPAGAGAPAA